MKNNKMAKRVKLLQFNIKDLKKDRDLYHSNYMRAMDKWLDGAGDDVTEQYMKHWENKYKETVNELMTTKARLDELQACLAMITEGAK